ncbi:MAG: LamG domain-containing protein, partial [Bacteroidota bacterium]
MKTTFCILTIFFLSVLSNQLLAQDHALDFKGSDGYVYCMNLFVSGSASRTVEAWVNPRTFKSNAGVFECGHGASGSGLINFGLRMGNSNEWKVELHDETLIYNSTGTLNTWNHFALVYDGTNVKLYHNGNLVINVARNINTIQSSFLIGRLASGFFDGKIDEVRFWNVARSQAQIQSAMYTELAGNEDGLLAEYRMNEGTGTTALNSSTRSDLNSYYNNYKSAEIRYDASWDYGFTTSFVPPTVATQAVTAITTTTATGNGNVTNLGVPNPTQYGVCWSTTANPTTTLSTKTEQGAKSATGAFTSSITSLTPGTLYHVRAYVTNSAGTRYGEDVEFTALKTPTVTTQTVTNITTTTATGNGNVTNLGVPNPTQYGVCWSTTANPTTTLST